MDRDTLDTIDYFNSEETTRPRELAYGMLREPPAPFFAHQEVALRIARLLSDHVESRRLGRVAIAPLDVVLDAPQALVVQPDVLFVSTPRLSIIRNQVWGAPDLVVEVLSLSTELHDRGEKLAWYQQYGVRECWLVDQFRMEIVVVDFAGTRPVRRPAAGRDTIRSTVFPELTTTADAIFA